MSYIDLPNVDTFHYKIPKNSNSLIPQWPLIGLKAWGEWQAASGKYSLLQF